jgi:hypothetical protein
MLKHNSIRPYSVPLVPHYLISFNPATGKFFHCETGEEIIVSPHDFNKNYAGRFILTPTVFLVDGTIVDSNQLRCDPKTGECVDKTTNGLVQLQPNQVHLVEIDHQNPPETDYTLISDALYANLKKNQGKIVQVKQVYNEFWNGPFYTVNYEPIPIQSINFDDLRLTKVVNLIDGDGDDYYFYTSKSPQYNPFGSPILFKIV